MKQFIVKEIPKTNLEISNFEMQGRTYRDQVLAGDVMPSYSIAEVVESNHPDFKIGQIVTSESYWEEFSLVKAKDVNKCPQNIPLSYLLSIFGIAGLTAYHGLFDVGRMEASDTVLISAAAGSVGIYAGQLAKAMGCKVIGIAGNDKKCKEVVDSLGFDGCINYKTGNLLKDLKEHCPEGISLYFDNVGGHILEAVLVRMQNRGRIVCCGAISQYESSSPVGPRNIPGFIITKRLKMEGFIVMDFQEKHLEAINHMKTLLDNGKIKVVEDIAEGLERAPEALVNLLNGKNFGKSMVRVFPDP